jgi:uncharacterized protein with PIN domain
LAEAVRFYLDEHVPRAVAQGLRRRGIDVLTVQEAGMAGADDERHLTFALQEGRVIVTQDADFLRFQATGRSHAGIAYAPQQLSVGAFVRGLVSINDVSDAQDMAGRVEYL